MSKTEKVGVLAMTVIVISIFAVVINSGSTPRNPLEQPGPAGKIRQALEEKETAWPSRQDRPPARAVDAKKKADRVFGGPWTAARTGASGQPAPGKAAAGRRAPRYRTYKIKDGDILGAIARRYLGSTRRWREIQKLNPGLDPKNLKRGTVIKLPPRARSAPRRRAR